MDVALASQLRLAGHMTATRAGRVVRPQIQLYSPKALHTSDHIQLPHEAPGAKHVPLIDLAHLSVSSSHSPTRTKVALATDCNEWGFFQVRENHVECHFTEKVDKFLNPCYELQIYLFGPGNQSVFVSHCNIISHGGRSSTTGYRRS
jgi:hypothetical protein